jgi:transposase
MRDCDLYSRILGIQKPWSVVDVKLDENGKSVEVFLECEEAAFRCPECDEKSPGYDRRERRWRHLDTCQFQTLLVAQVPRVSCDTHGVKQVRVPWADEKSRFTALMEALVIDWLQESANVSAVMRLVRLSWDEVDGIMQRAVARGLKRRELRLPRRVGVDEKSFQKRHEYVTVVTAKSDDASSSQSGHVLYVGDGRGKEILEGFWKQFPEEKRAQVESVAMDMWGPYIEATRNSIPDADSKIAFDKFHVAKHLGEAVDKVRREEHRALLAAGDRRLVKSKYLWLRHPAKMAADKWKEFESLRTSNLKTARAWALKETAMDLWRYESRGWAVKGWDRWHVWAIYSRLGPVEKAARMIRSHLYGILNAMTKRVTNAQAEGLNSVIQWLKYSARGFRSRERFRNAIYFHLGGLQLYPASLRAHSNA